MSVEMIISNYTLYYNLKRFIFGISYLHSEVYPEVQQTTVEEGNTIIIL